MNGKPINPSVDGLFLPPSKRGPTLSDLVSDVASHPFVQLERIAGITSTEAAARLGLSMRQYQRYKKVTSLDQVALPIRLLLELGALQRHPRPLDIDRRLQQWIDTHPAGDTP